MRLITDPLLRQRVGPLLRGAPAVDAGRLEPDAVLVSHLDRDHLDLPTLAAIGRQRRLIVPSGGERFARRRGFEAITELARGESAPVGALTVTAVPAVHNGRRRPLGARADTVGYVVSGTRRVYFAGDTELFVGMGELAPGLDLALLPVSGWGPTLGAGHLDPTDAARALALLRPRLAVPIHWGTLRPIGLGRLMSRQLTEPPHEFARAAARVAPEVEVHVLAPGESLSLE